MTVTYQQSQVRTIEVGLLALLLAAGVVLAAITGAFLVWGLFAALMAFGIWRTWRVSLTVADEGVTVRNFLRDHHLRWDEIARAEMWKQRLLQHEALYLVCTDGRELPCHVFKGSLTDDQEVGRKIVEAVNARSVDR